VKKLSPKATAPTRGSAFAAGYDLYAAHETTVPARGKTLIDTELAIAVPEGTCKEIFFPFFLLILLPPFFFVRFFSFSLFFLRILQRGCKKKNIEPKNGFFSLTKRSLDRMS
jgi:dUTPase